MTTRVGPLLVVARSHVVRDRPGFEPARLPRVCAVTWDYMRGPKVRIGRRGWSDPIRTCARLVCSRFGATVTPRATRSVLPVRQTRRLLRGPAADSLPGSVGPGRSANDRDADQAPHSPGPKPAGRAPRRTAASTSARQAGYKARRAHRRQIRTSQNVFEKVGQPERVGGDEPLPAVDQPRYRDRPVMGWVGGG
jgi:hypothetical protein